MSSEIIANFVYPPIPMRNFDWEAYRDGTMDADYDYEKECYVSATLIGHGETKQAAIDDLLEQEADHA